MESCSPIALTTQSNYYPWLLTSLGKGMHVIAQLNQKLGASDKASRNKG